jgi:hypothetical protein
MLHKEEFTKTHSEVRAGMTAYTMDGNRLGVIETIDDDGITIEEGRIFHKDVHVDYDDIEDVSQDDVFIRRGRETLEREVVEEPVETRETVMTGETVGEREYARGPEEKIETRESTSAPESTAGRETTGRREYTRGPEEKMETRESGRRGAEEEVRIPIREEELEAQKREREGEVRIPVREEVAEVTKGPVVEEEIRVSKEAYTEEEEVSGEVRKERVKVDRTAPSEKK